MRSREPTSVTQAMIRIVSPQRRQKSGLPAELLADVRARKAHVTSPVGAHGHDRRLRLGQRMRHAKLSSTKW